MKKVLFILLTALLVVSCHKEPSMSDLSNDLIVLTNYDTQANFSDYVTYYLPDSILIISDNPQATYWTEEQAGDILSTIEELMNQRGYVRIDNRNEADLGIQTSYVQNITLFYGYSDPYWWWDYPGYWGPGYWGWDGWYYPYPISYSYRTGSMLAEIVDLKAKTPRRADAGSKLPVIWTAYMEGLAYNSKDYNAQLVIRALNQAFRQSMYITNLLD